MSSRRQRRERARNQDGEWKTKEGQKTSNHLFQLPTGRAPEALPKNAVLGAARARRVGCLHGPHADTGGWLPKRTKKNKIKKTPARNRAAITCHLLHRWKSGSRTGAPSSRSCGKTAKSPPSTTSPPASRPRARPRLTRGTFHRLKAWVAPRYLRTAAAPPTAAAAAAARLHPPPPLRRPLLFWPTTRGTPTRTPWATCSHQCSTTTRPSLPGRFSEQRKKAIFFFFKRELWWWKIYVLGYILFF